MQPVYIPTYVFHYTFFSLIYVDSRLAMVIHIEI